MSFINVVLAIVAFFVALIWIVILTSIFKTYSSGDLLLKFSDKMTKNYLILGVGLFIYSILNIYTLSGYDLGMKIINWVAFPTIAFEFLYFAFTRMQFREKAFIWNNFVTRYEDIQSFTWETDNRLCIIRKSGPRKTIRIVVLPANKKEIDRKLTEMIDKATQSV